MNEKKELMELENSFRKCADIIAEIIQTKTILDKTQKDDVEKIKELNNKIEERMGMLMIQMLKISNFNMKY